VVKEEEVIAHREVVEDEKKVNITTIYINYSVMIPSCNSLDAQFNRLLIVIRANKYIQLYTSPK